MYASIYNNNNFFRSFEESIIQEITIDSQPEQFTLIEGGSTKGKNIVATDYGFSFTLKEETAAKSTWCCSVRRKGCYCPATLIYKDGDYTMRGKHLHEGEPGLLEKIQLRKEVGELCSYQEQGQGKAHDECRRHSAPVICLAKMQN